MCILHDRSWKWVMQKKPCSRWEVGGLLRSRIFRDAVAGGGEGIPLVQLFGVSNVLFHIWSQLLIMVTPWSWYLILILQAGKLRLNEFSVHPCHGVRKGRAWLQSQVFNSELKDLSPHHCRFHPFSRHLQFSVSFLSASTWLRILAFRPFSHMDLSQSLAALLFPSSCSTGFLLMFPAPGGFPFLLEAPWGG